MNTKLKNLCNEKLLLKDFFEEFIARYDGVGELDLEVIECNKSNLCEPSVAFKVKGCCIAPNIRVSQLEENIESYGTQETIEWVRGLMAEVPKVEVEDIYTKEYVLNHIKCRLLNKEKNRHFEEYLYRDFLDLMVLLVVEVTLPDGSKGGYALSRNNAKVLGLSDVELFERAMANLNAESIVVRDLNDTLGECYNAVFDEEIDVDNYFARGFLYFVSTETSSFGAVALLCMDVVAKQLGLKEFYILPSSVHEVLVCPKNEMPFEALRKMVCEVNEDVLSQTDFLSNSVYYYNGEEVSVAVA